MRLNIAGKLDKQIKREKDLLAAGLQPKPRIKNRIQRAALRFLTGFLAIMLAFTVISRAASAAATATVSADTAKSGVLTDRAAINGQIEAADDYYLSLPSGLRIESILAKAGRQVKEGGPLLSLDPEEVAGKLESLEYDAEILKLKITAAQSGVTGDAAEGIIAARQALDDAEREYQRLAEKLDRGDERSGEDLAERQTALEKAKADFDTVVQKTKNALIKDAEDKLKQARDNLEAVQESADDAVRAAQQALNQAAGSADRLAYQKALETYNRAKAELDQAKRTLSELEAAPEQDPDAVAGAREAVANAQLKADNAKAELDALNYSGADYGSALDHYNAAVSGWNKKIQKAKDAVTEAESGLNKAKARTDFTDEAAVITAQSAIDAAALDIKNAERDREDGIYSREDQLYEAEKAVETARRGLETAQRQAAESSREDSVASAQAQIDRLTYQNALDTLERQKTALKQAAENGGTVLSPISGTVLKTLEKGAKTQEGSDTVTISGSELGHLFEGSLDQKTAAKLSAGDKGTLTYTSEGKSKRLEVQITSIGTPDDEGMCAVTASLPAGSYPTGVSGELTVTRKSETYSSCLPLSALRSGSEGDYVLVLREKKTVMGTEWTVEKVPVTVKDRDSELMSIESTLMWEDKVVVSSSKPIAEGDRVRLEN